MWVPIVYEGFELRHQPAAFRDWWDQVRAFVVMLHSGPPQGNEGEEAERGIDGDP